MKERINIGLMTEAGLGDLVTAPGGCAVGGTAAQTVEGVLAANRGEWREWPLLGGEVRRMMHGPGRGMIWAQRAREMCREAGVAVSRVTVKEGGRIVVE